MGKSRCHAVNSRTRSLAEAVILQSIEDLWNPAFKRGSLLFFEGNGFELFSELAGISYTKRLAVIKMIADAIPKTGLRTTGKAL